MAERRVVDKLVEVVDLKTHFFTDLGVVKGVDGVSFDIYPASLTKGIGWLDFGPELTALEFAESKKGP